MIISEYFSGIKWNKNIIVFTSVINSDSFQIFVVFDRFFNFLDTSAFDRAFAVHLKIYSMYGIKNPVLFYWLMIYLCYWVIFIAKTYPQSCFLLQDMRYRRRQWLNAKEAQYQIVVTRFIKSPSFFKIFGACSVPKVSLLSIFPIFQRLRRRKMYHVR